MTQTIAQTIGRGCEYVGFEPNETLLDQAASKFARVFGESPSDSSTTAVIRKTNTGFEGKLKIHSAVGTFVADVIGEDPLRVINSMTRKVRSQLRMWKRIRLL